MPNIAWDIRREGRAWHGPEAQLRYALTPPKIEMIEGKLFWSDEDRLRMLALLLENVLTDQAVRLGDPQRWREAIAQIEHEISEYVVVLALLCLCIAYLSTKRLTLVDKFVDNLATSCAIIGGS